MFKHFQTTYYLKPRVFLRRLGQQKVNGSNVGGMTQVFSWFLQLPTLIIYITFVKVD